ncbi:RmlC-like cupins superfamily protein [Striga hermonthica]|uniref:RmlC-like cupins superfamily protein n=1 Tax=Striga hermonthica TaxID=68872 RepID=A0A9N7NZR0_STRHE|nr:RmlC-like cupins superfamily protein [Striga hermonthica]
MSGKRSVPVLCLLLWCAVLLPLSEERFLVKREQRKTLFSTEDGEISAVRVAADNINGSYLLHFFTLEPNSLFLPSLLHADMVFYVHTGSGKLSWTEEDDLKSTDIRRGDAYRIEQGSVFFIQSNLETDTERQKLRIHAIFANSKDDLHEPAATGPYSSIRDMVLGFDRQVLQAAFQVSEDVIDELVNGTNAPAIIHGLPRTTKGETAVDIEARVMTSLLATRSYNIFEVNKKKKKKSGAKLFNIFKEDKDFENCNGWSTTVTRKKLSALKGTDIGLFMVNLTIGSMMGPHWNPTATEIAVVLQGRGMIRVVCSSISEKERAHCRNTRFEVEQGDVFAVPRFHPMAQISFNNETLVLAGFSTSAKRNHPQFLAGQGSVLRALDKDVLAMSFNVSNTTLDQLLSPQKDSVILGCVSCAEEELRVMKEEAEREKEEEMKRREEERKREEEEAREREEEAAKREEEERERQREQEEAARREKEEREKEEREKQREEEEEAGRREEEERERQREQEEAARREEEERERQKEQEEAARREEEERERQKEQEEAARREEEERERQREQEEAARREEEERERQREQEEEEVARREEEERERQREQEERGRREEEERERQEEEEAGRSEEEEAAEAERRREEAAARREEEEARRQEEKEEREWGGGGGGETEYVVENLKRRLTV